MLRLWCHWFTDARKAHPFRDCPVCFAYCNERKPADKMQGEERAQELKHLLSGNPEMCFKWWTVRVQELVGRKVYAGEIGVCNDFLIEEARAGIPVALEEAVERCRQLNQEIQAYFRGMFH